jgi:DNA-binding CsgD family transcriptional regulator
MSLNVELGFRDVSVVKNFTDADYDLAYLDRNNLKFPPAVRNPKTVTAAERSLPSVMGMLGRIGFGYVVLDESMKVIEWNEPARVTLEVSPGTASPSKAVADAFKRLTANVSCKFTPGTLSWVVVPYKGATPVIVHDETFANNCKICIVMLMSRETSPQPNPARLQQMFGLTSAESQLATSLVAGLTPLEVAQRSKLSRTTIRSHLAALFLKTDTKRQSELVALLGQISVLP